CAALADGFGSGATPTDPNYWGAADLGCVDSTRVMPFAGKPHPRHVFDDLRPLYRPLRSTF
ncbi:MAG TPA: hypothetical protein VLB44_14415, partial [Kofleriaceae bacterium]|nr:hypothetical protein [Kofleriaceae bacterium]